MEIKSSDSEQDHIIHDSFIQIQKNLAHLSLETFSYVEIRKGRNEINKK